MNLKKLIDRKLIFILVFIAIIYSGLFQNGFVWDDEVEILGNDYIREISLTTIKNCFIPGKIDPYIYHPLPLIIHSFNYFIWKLNPAGYHLFFLFFYILSLILIYFFILGVFEKENTAFFSTLLFAVHPYTCRASLLDFSRPVYCGRLFYLCFFTFFHKVFLSIRQ